MSSQKYTEFFRKKISKAEHKKQLFFEEDHFTKHEEQKNNHRQSQEKIFFQFKT